MASKNKKSVLTPKGRINYPYLVNPDTGREYSDDAYKLDFLIPKDLFIGSDLEKAIQEIAVAEFGAAKAKKVKLPQKFLWEEEGIPESMKDFVQVRAKNKNDRPLIVNGQKEELDSDEIAKIKSGDHAILYVTVFPYNQQGGGISLGLDIVQYIKKGEQFEGTGNAKKLAQMATIEVEEVTAETVEDLLK